MSRVPGRDYRFADWLKEQRKARDLTPEEVRKRLQEQRQFGMGPSTYAMLESAYRQPTDEQREHLAGFFGSTPPPPLAPAEQSSDLARLAAAIEAQTDVNRQLVTVVSQLAFAIHQAREVPPDWFVERGDEWTGLVLRTIRQALEVGGSDEPTGLAVPLPGRGR